LPAVEEDHTISYYGSNVDDLSTLNNKEVMVTQSQLERMERKTQIVNYKNYPQLSTYLIARKGWLLIHSL
jgi:hypothetical protein